MTLPLNVPVDAIIDPTVMFGVPVNPADVPVVFWFSVGILAAPIVPDEILDALIDVIFAPPPRKLVAVTVPETFTFCKKVAFVFVLILSVAAIPVSADPSPSLSNNVPAEFGKTTVGFPENCECGGACNLK